MSFFDHVPLMPPDPILGLGAAFRADPRKEKINLSIGVYQTEDLKTPILHSVHAAELHLLESEQTKEYLPIDGSRLFVEKTGELLFGGALWHTEKTRIYGTQTVGGTSALRTGGEFLKQEGLSHMVVSIPTWPNHHGVFTRCGMHVGTYTYYDREEERLHFEALYKEMSRLEKGTVVLLHTRCHNPTGADLNIEQWKLLSDLFLEKGLFPFFDSAYQGFGEGLEEDAYPVRLFLEAGHEMFVASSYSKNFSLYSERVGALFVVTKSAKLIEAVSSRIRILIRTLYSNPPRHGALVVETILQSPTLKKIWEKELCAMRERITFMRTKLATGLIELTGHEKFRYLFDRFGMFSFLPLNKAQVEQLLVQEGIYMINDGRINVGGLNEKNLPKVIDALGKVLYRK